MMVEDRKQVRTARSTRPQLVCVLADNSASMQGEKAQAATEGIRELLLECQTTGPRGAGRDYFHFVLIEFGSEAELACDMQPVREIDADTIEVLGDGGGTNITGALQLLHEALSKYMKKLESHPESDDHPLPLVLLFSDGHNGYGKPEPIARKIKQLNLNGEHVVVACAGVATERSDDPDEILLKSVASPNCYIRIEDADMLGAFLAEVGSSGASTAEAVARAVHQIPDLRGLED